MTQPRRKISVEFHECGHSKNGRNLVVCIDGTSNQFGDKNTNVIELYSLILKHIQDNQKTWYNSGIGTYARPSWKSLQYYKNVLYHKVDLAIAWNFERTVQGAYQWLSDNYEEGDCIFLFGFSRGAFQVRVLAGMIDKVGLIHKGNELQIPFAYEVYKDEETDVVAVHAGAGSGQAPMSKAERFKNTFSHKDVRVHFVGAWDTVSSIGLVRGKRMLPRTVDGMKHVCYFRHALALDERRVKFLPEYAYGGDTVDRAGQQPDPRIGEETNSSSSSSMSPSTSSSSTASTKTSIPTRPHTKEVWFAGTHSDIGGGNVDNPTLDRGRPPLRWMVFEAAAAGLRLQPFKRELSLKEQVEVIESLTWVWKPLEFLPLKRLTFGDGEEIKATTNEPHFGGSRRIKHGQKIHSSVLLADTNVRYSPKAKPPDDVDAATFWYKLREGKEVFEEWVEEDISHFMRQLVKSALAEQQSNKQLEDLLLPASTRGGQGLYTTVIMALRDPELLPNLESKNHLLNSLMIILKKTFWIDRLELVPSGDVLPSLQDLMTSGNQEYQAVAKAFVENFTDCSLQRIPAPNRVWGIAHSADGRWVAWAQDQSQSATASHIVQLWDALQGKPALQPFEGHTEYIGSVAFSRNGRFLASASQDRTVRIWDLEAKNPVSRVFVGHTGPVESVAFSPDGRCLVSGSVDHTLRIWEVATGHLKCPPLTGHKAQVTFVAVSPDGRYIASASVDKTVRIWDLGTGAAKRAIYGISSSIWAVAFSPDSRRVVVALAGGSVAVWDVEWIKQVFKTAGHAGPVCAAVFSPDGEYIASSSYDRTVAIWDARTGNLVKSLKGHTDRIFCLAYSPDGRYIYSGADDGTVRKWDARVPKEVGDAKKEL